MLRLVAQTYALRSLPQPLCPAVLKLRPGRLLLPPSPRPVQQRFQLKIQRLQARHEVEGGRSGGWGGGSGGLGLSAYHRQQRAALLG